MARVAPRGAPLNVCVSQTGDNGLARRLLRWSLIVVGAVCIAVGIVFVCITSFGGGQEARALAGCYVAEAERGVETVMARVTPFGPSQEDYRVYSAVIDAMYSGDVVPPPIYLMTEWPDEARPTLERKGECFERTKPTAAVIQDFKARNRFQWGLSRRFRLAWPTTWLRPIDLSEPVVGDTVERLALSRVGYDTEHRLALVYIAHLCPLCGSGTYVVVERNPAANWAVAGWCRAWVS